MAEPQYNTKKLVTIAVVLLIVGTILWSLPSTMRNQAQELKCKLRLLRLGDAVNAWVYDHKFNGFPPIKNPAPFTLWQPERMSSASLVLRQYLGGNIPRPRHHEKGESQEDYVKRLRTRDWAVCPSTGYDYWYNSLVLDESDSRTAAQEPEKYAQEFKYFTCQHHTDTAPHESDGETGVFSCYSTIVHRLITKEDVDELESSLRAREQENAGLPREKWTHDLTFLRKRISAFRHQIYQHPQGYPAITLSTDIRFIPDLSNQ